MADSPNEDSVLRSAAHAAARQIALSTRSVSHLVSLHVGYAVDLSGRADSPGPRAAALCDGAASRLSQESLARTAHHDRSPE